MKLTKFRGKRIDNGEWVIGNYFVTPLTDENSGTTPDKGWFFLTGETRHCISTETGVVFVVSEESVGQFIELKDKKGVAISVGDIIRTQRGDWGVIAYKAPFFGVTVSETDICHYTEEFITESEVIGNIHDNPELLKD